ncbi:hypothetical protein AZE42_10669 [Rhizopogon vesiculosus]|uniref:RNase H type-1 domain-containing protein n=1 Tax=Rhizopogon vesiculosus TaxID=180088 RepID=A0A1J8Q9U0_9AGAM|nr:hypothetical protein AZE42_10669 [Rhizopogon vesiculosus]
MHHRSSLHHLFHSTELDLINPTIAPSREQAIADHDSNEDEIKIYCDGSGINQNIGAAAVLYCKERPQPRVLRYHLGSADEHTVYESEAVGLTLAAQLISTEDDITFQVSIYVDNQAAIKSGDIFSTNPGHYLIDHFRRLIMQLKKTSQDRDFKVNVRWISRHDGVEGNEEADREAKTRFWQLSPRYE